MIIKLLKDYIIIQTLGNLLRTTIHMNKRKKKEKEKLHYK